MEPGGGIRGQKQNSRYRLQCRQAAGPWSMTGRRSLLPVPERIGVTFSQWPTPVRGGGARYRSFGSFLSTVSRRIFRLLCTSRGSSSSGMTDTKNTWLVLSFRPCTLFVLASRISAARSSIAGSPAARYYYCCHCIALFFLDLRDPRCLNYSDQLVFRQALVAKRSEMIFMKNRAATRDSPSSRRICDRAHACRVISSYNIICKTG
jgi:hypothetical protein